MAISRRKFLKVTTAVGTALHFPLSETSIATPLEPTRFDHNDNLIRLYSNENAYGPSVAVRNAIASATSSANRYPRLQYPGLMEYVAGIHKVRPEQVLLGCGSTEILRMTVFAFLTSGKRLIQASPTFEAIGKYAETVGANNVTAVPLTRAFAHDLDGMLAHADASAGLVYICNPNNPTGSITPRRDIETFISKLSASTFVLIDEAYHHYAGKSGMYASFIDHPIDDERVIVTRTFSKVYGLAGLRLGYAIGSAAVIQQMHKFAVQDNVNAIATQAATAALDDVKGVSQAIQRNTNDREEFFNQALGRSLTPIDSHTNFVMMNTFHPADEVISHFRSNNILIGRRFPPMDSYIRVSLGLPEEMLAFWRVWDALPYDRNLRHH
jgi:histidinol-phosphate aminotransferase